MLLRFLLASSALFSAITLAQTAQDLANQIKFCSDENMQGDCAWIWYNFDTCYYIPDSNAKGDKHSSFNVTAGNDHCQFYTDDNDCKGGQNEMAGALDICPTQGLWFNQLMDMNLSCEKQVRTFKCVADVPK